MIATNRIRRHMRGWKPFPPPEARKPKKRWTPIFVLVIETIVLIAVVGLIIILGGVTDSPSVEE